MAEKRLTSIKFITINIQEGSIAQWWMSVSLSLEKLLGYIPYPLVADLKQHAPPQKKSGTQLQGGRGFETRKLIGGSPKVIILQGIKYPVHILGYAM